MGWSLGGGMAVVQGDGARGSPCGGQVPPGGGGGGGGGGLPSCWPAQSRPRARTAPAAWCKRAVQFVRLISSMNGVPVDDPGADPRFSVVRDAARCECQLQCTIIS